MCKNVPFFQDFGHISGTQRCQNRSGHGLTTFDTGNSDTGNSDTFDTGNSDTFDTGKSHN